MQGRCTKEKLGLREWIRKDARYDSEFAKDPSYSEPHMSRKRRILREYPQIRLLYGTASETIYCSVLIVLNQMLLAYLFSCNYEPTIRYWGLFICAASVLGGSMTAMIGVIVHELCHNLAHPNPLVNRLTGFLINIPMLVPVAASFKRYHLEHHAWQGVEGKDPDLPMAWEIVLIRGNPILKVLWLAIYPIMYGVRTVALKKTPSQWEYLNLVWVLTTDLVLYKVLGAYGVSYLALSVWFGYTFHPAAAHFIQEHYTFKSGQETYSYYGPANWLFLNIGLHNEHHDFVQIPWTKIWALYYIAKEYYEPLEGIKSWTGLHINFILDRQLGPVSRIVRSVEVHRKDRKHKL